MADEAFAMSVTPVDTAYGTRRLQSAVMPLPQPQPQFPLTNIPQSRLPNGTPDSMTAAVRLHALRLSKRRYCSHFCFEYCLSTQNCRTITVTDRRGKSCWCMNHCAYLKPHNGVYFCRLASNLWPRGKWGVCVFVIGNRYIAVKTYRAAVRLCLVSVVLQSCLCCVLSGCRSA